MKITKEDREWAKLVKQRDDNKCAICQETTRLNAHHLIPREIEDFRHDIDNGITLCPLHHRFSRQLSAHQNPISFQFWLEKHRPLQLSIIKEKWTTYQDSELH